MGSPDCHMPMFSIDFQGLTWMYSLSWTRRNREQYGVRLASKAAITSGWHIRRAEVLGSLRHYLRTQSQGHHAIDRLEERGVEGGRDRRSSFEQSQHWKNIPETRWSVYEPSRERKCYLENCSEVPYNAKEERKVQIGNIS